MVGLRHILASAAAAAVALVPAASIAQQRRPQAATPAAQATPARPQRMVTFPEPYTPSNPEPRYAEDEPTYKVFQFPQDRIPRIDGDFSDWDMVPESYVVGQDQMREHDNGLKNPSKSHSIRVKVGWVKGLNRLYFLYEADDDYWDYTLPGLHNDTFELVVDADLTGGPLIDVAHQDIWQPLFVGDRASKIDKRVPASLSHWYNHGVQAQNYHIFTPHVDKDWTMVWGSPTWIKDFPYANTAQKFDFKPGQGGKYRMEFYITPFDYAGPEGPERAVESKLRENALIGLGWINIDYDDVNNPKWNGFWSLSKYREMFALASDLPLFQLMPVEPQFQPKLDARWSFKVVDMDRRMVAFHDDSVGKVTAWKWDFGDGTTSTEQHPIHTFKDAKSLVTILEVTGPDGTSKRSKVWDVQLR